VGAKGNFKAKKSAEKAQIKLPFQACLGRILCYDLMFRSVWYRGSSKQKVLVTSTACFGLPRSCATSCARSVALTNITGALPGVLRVLDHLFRHRAGARIGAAVAKGMALRALGRTSAMGASQVFLRHSVAMGTARPRHGLWPSFLGGACAVASCQRRLVRVYVADIYVT
jgi:hypothetical protein